MQPIENRVSHAGEACGTDRQTGGMRLGYLHGLDGLRALAVAAVLIYHAKSSWLPGGFLGVEVFFVISGYLITALLLAEWRERGRIDLPGFWMRRARRLLPAVFVMIFVTLAYAVLFLPQEVAGLRSDALAAFGYATNWYLIFGNESYFESVGRPSLLQHLWSLAIEEQFYLLWPPVIAAGLGFGARRWRRRRVLNLALAGAAVSALLMAILYQPGMDPSRLYYGTDTRATGLLIGAALAFLWVPAGTLLPAPMDPSPAERLLSGRFGWTRGTRRRWGWLAPHLLKVAGLVTLSGLICSFFLLDEYQAFLYRGGFAAVALTTAALISVSVHPKARLAPLEWAPVRWVGVRSYSIYLWHWPVFMVTRPELDVPLSSLPLLALRLAITVVLADISYRYVEIPIRSGALVRAWRSPRDARGMRRRRISTGWAASGVAILTVSAALGTAVVQAKPPEKPSYLTKTTIHTKLPAKATASDGAPKNKQAHGKEDANKDTAHKKELTQAGSGESKTKKERPASGVAAANAPAVPVTAVGDSVMLGAAPQLEEDIGTLNIIDAEVGLHPEDAINILDQRRAAGQLGDVVIVQIGENGPFSASQFDDMMKILEGHKAVFVNVRVPRAWETPNNKMLAAKVQQYPNATLIDWHSAGAHHPELFWEDGIHLRPKGAVFYSNLISDALKPKGPST